MPKNSESLNRSLFNLLHSKGFDPTLLDTSGKEIPTPEEAEVFQFNFIKDGEDYGKVTISIDGLHKLCVYFSDEVANSEKEESHSDDESWYKVLNQLKRFAQKYQLSFELKNVNHLKHDMAKREYMKKQERISEGYYPMGKKASYNDSVPSVKIVLQHTRQIEEGEKRYRNIDRIFLENEQGERFLAPTIKPGIARVYGRLIAEGDKPHGERWNHVTSLVEEYQKMSGFVRAVRNGQFNESAQRLVNEGINHYQSLRETLSKMAGHRGYNSYFESWTPSLMEDESEENNLNELFVQETLDPRIESVMPILNKLQKKVAEMKEVTELSEWADSLTEAPGPETLRHNVRTDAKNLRAFDLEESDMDEGMFDKVLDAIAALYGDDMWENDAMQDLANDLAQAGPTDQELDFIIANGKLPKRLAGIQFSAGDNVKFGEGAAVDAYMAGKSPALAHFADKLDKEIDEGSDDIDDPVVSSITRRIIRQHPELLKHGPDKVLAAIADVADFVGDVEEIGSSDVSGWVKQVERQLNGVDEGMFSKVKDTVKSVGGKVLDKLGHGSDEELLKKMQKDIGVPKGSQHGKPSMAKQKDDSDIVEDDLDESALQAYLGNKKYGKDGMDALRKAGREGASKEKMAQVRAKYDKLDEEGEFAGDYATGPAGQWRNTGPKAHKPAVIGDLVGEEFDPLKHISKDKQTTDIKKAAKDVKRGSYSDRAALMKAGGVRDDRGPHGVTMAEGEGNLSLALKSLAGGWSGWSKEEDMSTPEVDYYEYDDGEGNYYGSGTIEHNLKTGEIKVEYHDSESDVDVDDTFNSVGDAMKAIRGKWGQSHGGKAPNFDRLGQRKQHGPDDLRKTDRTGRKGSLAGGPTNQLKQNIQFSKGKHGPKGVLPEGQEDLDAILRIIKR